MTQHDEFATAIDAAIQPLMYLESELRRLAHYENDGVAQDASEAVWAAVRILQGAMVALEAPNA